MRSISFSLRRLRLLRRPFRPLAVLALLGFTGCSEDALTEIVVTVDTDVPVPAELDEVRLNVQGLGGPQQASSLVADASGLPVFTSLVHRGGPLGPITVTATGQKNGAEVVSRRARVFFVREDTRLLQLDLAASCRAATCAMDETCAPSGCQSIDRGELPPWPGAPPRIGGTDAAIDAGLDAAPDADAMADATADADAAIEAMTDADVVVPAVRTTMGLQALYEFNEGAGDMVMDTSGVGAPLHLTIDQPSGVTWGIDSLTIDRSVRITSGVPATKLIDAGLASNAITVEAWIATADIALGGPARIATLSSGTGARNFTLGQEFDRWELRLRTTTTNNNGDPSLLSTISVVQDALTHVVFTWDGSTGRWTCYLDGALNETSTRTGDLSPWDATMEFALANELSRNRAWRGTMHLVAVYDRALSEQEVLGNFLAGPNP
ncbi:MAG: LamG domain-containing protein [Myxococcota bacterium]